VSLNKFEEMFYANCSVTGRQKGHKEQGITDEDVVKKNGKEGKKGPEKIGKGTKTNETGRKRQRKRKEPEKIEEKDAAQKEQLRKNVERAREKKQRSNEAQCERDQESAREKKGRKVNNHGKKKT